MLLWVTITVKQRTRKTFLWIKMDSAGSAQEILESSSLTVVLRSLVSNMHAHTDMQPLIVGHTHAYNTSTTS